MNKIETLAFSDDLLSRKPPTGINVDTTLAHFAIITYLVNPDTVRQQIHPRFHLDLIKVDGRE